MFSNGKHVFGMPVFLTKLSSYKERDYFLSMRRKKYDIIESIDSI